MTWIEPVGWAALAAIAAWVAARLVTEIVVPNTRSALAESADAFDELIETLGRPAFSRLRKRDNMKAEQELLDWIDEMLGESPADDALNYDLLQAKKETPQIRRLVQEELPRNIVRCMRMHLIAAIATPGTERIGDVAAQPECLLLRRRVVTLEQALIVKLEHYPLLTEDETLLKSLIVLRRMRPTCGNCPYLNYRVIDAPRICPAADMAGIEDHEINNSGESHGNPSRR